MEPVQSGAPSLDAIMREVREELDRRSAPAAAPAEAASAKKSNFLFRGLTRAAHAAGFGRRRA